MSTAPAAANSNKASKNEGRASVPLESLFDDMEDKSDVEDDVKKSLPKVKKAGNWDSNGNNPLTSTMLWYPS